MAAHNINTVSEIIDPVTINFSYDCSTATVSTNTALTHPTLTYVILSAGSSSTVSDTWRATNSAGCFSTENSGTTVLEIFHEGYYQELPASSSDPLRLLYPWVTPTYTGGNSLDIAYQSDDTNLINLTFYLRVKLTDKWATAASTSNPVYNEITVTFRHECYTNQLSLATSPTPLFADFLYEVPAAGSGGAENTLISTVTSSQSNCVTQTQIEFFLDGIWQVIRDNGGTNSGPCSAVTGDVCDLYPFLTYFRTSSGTTATMKFQSHTFNDLPKKLSVDEEFYFRAVHTDPYTTHSSSPLINAFTATFTHQCRYAQVQVKGSAPTDIA